MLAKATVLFSGEPLQNSFQWQRIHVGNYKQASILIRLDDPGSGASYSLLGHNAPLEKVNVPFIITSGNLTTSGQVVVLDSGISNFYELQVGVEALQSNQSGIVTVVGHVKPR